MWTTLVSDSIVEKTMQAFEKNAIHALVVATKEEAKRKVLELIPSGVEVFAMSSVTLQTIGITQEIDESGKYMSVRKKLMSMNRETQGKEMRQLGATPDWAIGSVQAVTEDGQVLIASQSGSQLPAYANGANHVIWVVGTQKIVKNIDEGIRRIYEHCLPLEGERAKKVYGRAGSSVNKILIVNKDHVPGRITLIFVKEVLGF